MCAFLARLRMVAKPLEQRIEQGQMKAYSKIYYLFLQHLEHLLLEAAAGSAIPSGFFDDPLADLKARGVDIKKIEKKQEKREEAEFQRLLFVIH